MTSFFSSSRRASSAGDRSWSAKVRFSSSSLAWRNSAAVYILLKFTYIGAYARAKWTRVGASGRDGEIPAGDPLRAGRAANETRRSRQHVVTIVAAVEKSFQRSESSLLDWRQHHS